jgi:hypothetical protein
MNINKRRLLMAGASALAAGLAQGQAIRSQPAGGRYPAWLRDQPRYKWFEIPGAKLSAVDPSPAPKGHSRNKITAWNGAALETRNSVLWMGLSGGHADYAGNEINRIELGADVPRWEQVHPPSRLDFSREGKNWDVSYYEDGTPASRHTYNNQQFINSDGRLCWVGAGGVWGSGGKGSESFDYWDVKQRRFGTYASALDSIGESLRGPESMVVKHPLTEDIYFSRRFSGRYLKWTRATNTWQLIRRFESPLQMCSAAIDPSTDVLLRIGHFGGRSNRTLWVHGWQADTGRDGPGRVTLTGPAAEWFDSTDILKARGAALEWCNTLQKFVYYCGHLAPTQVIVIDPKGWAADYLPMTGLTPEKGAKPHYNRFRYAPELKAFILVDGWDKNIKCFRIAS